MDRMRAATNESVRGAAVGACVEATKPPRLNFARICLYCEERECKAPECVALYARSRWVVCPDCGGLGWVDMTVPCLCVFGVIEACPAPASDDRLVAV
jgi:hypothetical protein